MLTRSLFIVLGLLLTQLAVESESLEHRGKRAYLVYQPGLNWVQLVMGIGLPIEVDDNSITMGVVIKSYYELPNNVTYYTHPSIDIERRGNARRRRRVPEGPTRWDIYTIIQDFIQSRGYASGKACLLNSICETARNPFDKSAGLMAELLHVLLTPSTTKEETSFASDRDFHVAERAGNAKHNCQRLYPCETDMVRTFSNLGERYLNRIYG